MDSISKMAIVSKICLFFLHYLAKNFIQRFWKLSRHFIPGTILQKDSPLKISQFTLILPFF
jgi:hypothetical protein